MGTKIELTYIVDEGFTVRQLTNDVNEMLELSDAASDDFEISDIELKINGRVISDFPDTIGG